jgi:hypothetical protein
MTTCEHCRELINPVTGMGNSFWWLGPIDNPDYADCPAAPSGRHEPDWNGALRVADL